jgi:hypothetical protein
MVILLSLRCQICIAESQLLNRYRQKRCSHAGNWIDSSTRNLSTGIDVLAVFETVSIAGLYETVKVCHDTVLPNNGTTISKVRVA